MSDEVTLGDVPRQRVAGDRRSCVNCRFYEGGKDKGMKFYTGLGLCYLEPPVPLLRKRDEPDDWGGMDDLEWRHPEVDSLGFCRHHEDWVDDDA